MKSLRWSITRPRKHRYEGSDREICQSEDANEEHHSVKRDRRQLCNVLLPRVLVARIGIILPRASDRLRFLASMTILFTESRRRISSTDRSICRPPVFENATSNFSLFLFIVKEKKKIEPSIETHCRLFPLYDTNEQFHSHAFYSLSHSGKKTFFVSIFNHTCRNK